MLSTSQPITALVHTRTREELHELASAALAAAADAARLAR